MIGCVLLFANFKKVVKIQSFENFLTDECCSSLSNASFLASGKSWNFYKILLDDCILQAARRSQNS